jgi:hypothetical protein
MSKAQAEKLQINPKFIVLNSESNDIYIELTMCILTNQANLNKLQFTDDYINGVVENKDKFIGIPLQVNRTKLENGFYKTLDHELDKKTKLLKTDSIGSFVDFWSDIDEEDGSLLLMGLVRIHKRYPHVCDAVVELYESGDLEFSCEMLAYGYASTDDETGVRSVNYEFEGQVNSLFGSAIVTHAAEKKSKATLLVAEALEQDLKETLEGGETVPEAKVEVFNKGEDIKYYGEFELSSMKFSDVSNSIYNLINPINPQTNYRSYNYYVLDMYLDYAIVESWDDYTTLWRIPYTIDGDIVSVSPQAEWIKGKKGFIPDGVDIDALIESQKNATIEINNKIEELNNTHKEEHKLNEEQILEMQSKMTALEAKVTELNGMVVSQQETIVQHEASVAELNAQVETLTPFKVQVEVAEMQTKQSTMTDKFSKILSEDMMKSEDVTSAIAELNEVRMNEIVVAEIAKEKAETVVASKTNVKADVIVAASNQEDLIPQDRRNKLYEVRN